MRRPMFKIYVLILFLTLLISFFYNRVEILHAVGFSYRSIYNKKVSINKIDKLRQELDIVENTYLWSSEIKLTNNPKILVYHHAAIEEISAEEVDILHKEKGWAGIGYHYFIRKDGTIYTGRQELAIGAHVKGNNEGTIGICVEGNLEDEQITYKQLEAVRRLSIYLCLKYDIKSIVGHRELGTTLCPGSKFPLEELKEKVILGIKNFK